MSCKVHNQLAFGVQHSLRLASCFRRSRRASVEVCGTMQVYGSHRMEGIKGGLDVVELWPFSGVQRMSKAMASDACERASRTVDGVR